MVVVYSCICVCGGDISTYKRDSPVYLGMVVGIEAANRTAEEKVQHTVPDSSNHSFT